MNRIPVSGIFQPVADASGGGGTPAAAPTAPASGGGSLLSGMAAGNPPTSGNPPEAGTALGEGSPAPAVILGDDLRFSPGWMDKLPADLRTSPALATMPGLVDLARSYVATKSMVGKRLEAPGPDATADQLAAWKQTVGAPATAADYGDLRPDSVAKESWDAEAAEALRSLAHKYHLPRAAVQDLVALHTAGVTKAAQSFDAEAAAFSAAEKARLTSAWGADSPVQMQKAAAFAALLGVPAEHPMFASADMVMAMARGAQLFGGERLISGVAGGVASVAERIQAIQDPKSQETVAREYRGEFGAERQRAAQSTLHRLLETRAAAPK